MVEVDKTYWAPSVEGGQVKYRVLSKFDIAPGAPFVRVRIGKNVHEWPECVCDRDVEVTDGD